MEEENNYEEFIEALTGTNKTKKTENFQHPTPNNKKETV